MAKKSKSADGTEFDVQEPVNVFEPNFSNVNPEFNFDNLIQTYQETLKDSDKKKISITDRIQKQKETIVRVQAFIQTLEQKLLQESSLTWVNSILKPVVNELQKIFENCTLEMTPPMGLSNAVTITLCRKGVSAQNKLTGTDCRSITVLQSGEGDISIRDYSQDTGEFPKGSIGFLNHMNHPLVQVPRHEIFQTLASWLLKQ